MLPLQQRHARSHPLLPPSRKRCDTSAFSLGEARIERATGRLYRRFILPDSIDTEQMKATGRNGVLEISIPKQGEGAATPDQSG